MKLQEISFQTFKEKFEEFFKRTAEIRKVEEWCSLPRMCSYPYSYIKRGLEDGELNAENFQSDWVADYFIEEWNKSMCGARYALNLKRYDNIISDSSKIQLMETIIDKSYGWGYHYRKFEDQMRNDKKPSFYIFHSLYSDTKSPFRHWWDTYNNENMFKVGDMVELRSTANRNHIMKAYRYTSGTEVLRSVGYTTSQSLKGNLLMVLAYQEKPPPQTYSYKKGKGGTKMVTLLPVGSTEKIYIAEQFLKVSRKQGVKEARGKKK